MDLLKQTKMKSDSLGKEQIAYNPKTPYSIFVNYELGMHCVGFDVSYCCIIPPYNSVQAQVVQSGSNGVLIHFMREGDQNLSITGLIEKYPYKRSKEVMLREEV